MRATFAPITTIAVTLFALALGGCASSSGNCPLFHNDKAMIEAAKKVDADFVAAFNKGDVDAAAACYWNSPDLVVYPPAELECHGWQATRDALARVFKDNPGAHLEVIDPHYRVAGHDVIGYGRWTLTPANGKGQPLQGRFTQVMSKKDGKWVYILDHPSVPMS
jgi:ketosteroid isomerase-like protein